LRFEGDLNMQDEEIHTVFGKQSTIITTLLLRVYTLEKLMVEKKLVTEEDLIKKTEELSLEFIEQLKSNLQNVNTKK
jgi:predicted ribosome quality control (RQC) complex YloA/Tae2 family protein